MVDGVERTAQVEQNECSHTISVGGAHEVIVYGSNCCFRRVESAVGLLFLGQQIVAVDA